MNEEKKKVARILRSLIISSPQKGKSIRELVRDYREFEGSNIPIFEFRTVEEFLRSTGEFVFGKIGDDLIICEKPNAGSSHIAKLVAEQNRPKRRATGSNRSRQFVRPLNFPSQRTAYPLRSLQKIIFPRRNVSLPPVQQRPPPTTMEYTFEQLKSQRTQNNQTRNVTPIIGSQVFNGSNHQSNQPPMDLRIIINQKREKQSSDLIDLTGSDMSDSGQHNNQLIKPISPVKVESIVSHQHQNDILQPPTKVSSFIRPPLLTSNPFFDTSIPPPNVQFSRMQDRLKNQQKSDIHTIVNRNVHVNMEQKSVQGRLESARQAQASDIPAGNVKPTPQQSPVTLTSPTLRPDEILLFDYCKENDLSIPKFKLFKVDNRFQCHVTIGNIRYSSYPTDYASETEARNETAKHAIERLTIRDQQKYGICLDSEVELAIKILECIKDYPTGIFSKKIPETFLSLHRQLLPNDWMATLAKHPECFTIEECIDDQIVYVVEAPKLVQKMDKLQLPWDDEYWSLIITCTVSTAEVWGRLVGKDHSNALDSLVTDIELELLKNKRIPSTFNVGEIYLVVVHECAYRVRVEKIDDARRQCLCFGVDEGDQRWYDMGEMYACENKFLKLAPQAIRFALHGMEEFDENKFAKKHLEDTLLNSPPLIGQIFTRKEDFVAQEESSDLVAVIQVVLYDTSTSEDINLHQVIVDKICADIPAPELKHLELMQVIVSHIGDNGDIFIQLEQNGVHYVNKLIHKLTQSNVSNRNQSLPASNSSNNNLFLVFDEEAHKWCRGKLINEMKDIKSNEMLLVDYGKTKMVPLAKIYRLESLSQALLTFPPQAIQVKLNGLTEFPAHLVSTLRGYFSGDKTAYVMKVSATNVIPHVKLYYLKDSNMINVKDCIELELQRQQVSETTFSRQSSTNSNPSRDIKDDLSNFDNLTLNGRKLPKFQPPEVNDYFDIEVVMTAAPNNFQIRPNKYMRQWTQQMKCLQDYCNKSHSSMTLNMIRDGETYACLHSDGKWYRAIVDRRLASKIYVYFCDIGDIDEIDDVNKLKILPDEYWVLPKLAINAKLFGIKPINSHWEMDDVIAFNRIVSTKKFQAIVGKIIENENPDANAVLEIRLIDVSNEYDICINDELVKDGRAMAHLTN